LRATSNAASLYGSTQHLCACRCVCVCQFSVRASTEDSTAALWQHAVFLWAYSYRALQCSSNQTRTQYTTSDERCCSAALAISKLLHCSLHERASLLLSLTGQNALLGFRARCRAEGQTSWQSSVTSSMCNALGFRHKRSSERVLHKI
jgi:hypothetical protein